MIRELTVSKSIKISASPEAVWSALTDPEKIKIYLFGTETITDWKVGSPIIFQGEYDGHKYKDKGNVLQNKPNELLQYNYWAQFSQLEDRPENYSIVTYRIELVAKHQVKFTWMQEGFSSEQGHEHTENGLPAMLEQIKQIAED